MACTETFLSKLIRQITRTLGYLFDNMSFRVSVVILATNDIK